MSSKRGSSARPAATSEPAHRIGGHEGICQLTLEPRNLRTQRPPGGALGVFRDLAGAGCEVVDVER